MRPAARLFAAASVDEHAAAGERQPTQRHKCRRLALPPLPAAALLLPASTRPLFLCAGGGIMGGIGAKRSKKSKSKRMTLK